MLNFFAFVDRQSTVTKHSTVHLLFCFCFVLICFFLKFGQCNSSNISIFYSQIRSFKITAMACTYTYELYEADFKSQNFLFIYIEEKGHSYHPEGYTQKKCQYFNNKGSFCEPSTLLNTRISEDLVSCGSRKY